MGAAPKLDVFHRGRATRGIWRDMMQFKEALFSTTAAVAAYKGASAAITEPDCAPDLSRYVPRAGDRFLSSSRSARRGLFPLGDFLEECCERAIKDRGWIPVGDLMA